MWSEMTEKSQILILNVRYTRASHTRRTRVKDLMVFNEKFEPVKFPRHFALAKIERRDREENSYLIPVPFPHVFEIRASPPDVLDDSPLSVCMMMIRELLHPPSQDGGHSSCHFDKIDI
jgi:hypothetical protein